MVIKIKYLHPFYKKKIQVLTFIKFDHGNLFNES